MSDTVEYLEAGGGPSGRTRLRTTTTAPRNAWRPSAWLSVAFILVLAAIIFQQTTGTNPVGVLADDPDGDGQTDAFLDGGVADEEGPEEPVANPVSGLRIDLASYAWSSNPALLFENLGFRGTASNGTIAVFRGGTRLRVDDRIQPSKWRVAYIDKFGLVVLEDTNGTYHRLSTPIAWRSIAATYGWDASLFDQFYAARRGTAPTENRPPADLLTGGNGEDEARKAALVAELAAQLGREPNPAEVEEYLRARGFTVGESLYDGERTWATDDDAASDDPGLPGEEPGEPTQ